MKNQSLADGSPLTCLIIAGEIEQKITDEKAIIEYVDIEEINTLMIAMSKDSIDQNNLIHERRGSTSIYL